MGIFMHCRIYNYRNRNLYIGAFCGALRNRNAPQVPYIRPLFAVAVCGNP